MVSFLLLSVAASLASTWCLVAGLATAAMLFKWSAIAWLFSAAISAFFGGIEG